MRYGTLVVLIYFLKYFYFIVEVEKVFRDFFALFIIEVAISQIIVLKINVFSVLSISRCS